MKAVIPAAGLGMRFLPATKAQPKEMLPVVDKPCIQYVVEEAVAAGLTDIVIITGRGKRAIEDHFDRAIELENRLKNKESQKYLDQIKKVADLADIFYIRQKEPLGLGHAVLCAKKHIGNEPFAVLLGDDLIIDERPAIGQLIKIFEEMGKKSTVGIEQVAREDASKYGIISGKEIKKDLYLLDDLIEKPAPGKEPSDLAVIGRYVFNPEILDILERIEKGYGDEIQLTDAMRIMAQKDKMYGVKISGRRYDIGSKLDWLKANIELSLEREEFDQELRKWLEKSIRI